MLVSFKAIENALLKSKFRSSFKFKPKDITYIERVGLDTIKSHAYDFIINRISKAFLENDGKQTPFKGHPVFIAQHATATCCRKCIEKWHKIPQKRALTNKEISYLQEVIMSWINLQLNKRIDQDSKNLYNSC